MSASSVLKNSRGCRATPLRPANRGGSIGLTLIVAITLLAAQAANEPLETGRELTGMFFGRELSTLWERFSDELREALDAQGGLPMFRDLVEENLGDEAHVLDDYVTEQEGMHLYVRHSIFQNYGETVELRWTFDDDGVVHGFEVVPG